MKQNQGTITRVRGVVVDVSFSHGNLPSINNALALESENTGRLVLEVQEHLDANTARTIAMGSTSGLRRGLLVNDSGGPIQVPVGKQTLGRIFNVLGEPIDGQGSLPSGIDQHPIHADSPSLPQQRVINTPYVTGIKAIDLLTPYPQGVSR